MIKNKKAFSLSELFIALTMVIIAIVFMVSTLKNKLPNLDKLKVRNAYSQILRITQNLLNDTKDIYPNSSGFADTTTYTDKVSGEEFSGDTKFTDLFAYKLNKTDSIPFSLGYKGQPVCCKNIDSLYSPDACTREKGGTSLTTCFKTSKNLIYCLPKKTIANPEDANTINCFNSLNPSRGFVIIRVYIDDKYTKTPGNYQLKRGHYFALNAAGKVSILPPDVVFQETNFCADENNYNEYDHCKTNDYLLYSKSTE